MRISHLMLNFLLTVLLAGTSSACLNSTQVASVEISVTIPCVLTPGEVRPLSLRGQIPTGAEIKWEATEGEVTSITDLTANYQAPAYETTDIITVRIVANNIVTVETLSCVIKEQALTVIATPNEPVTDAMPPVEIATVTADDVQEDVIITVEADTEDPESPHIQPVILSISITEVMADPCGETRELETANEYVELYNYGNLPIDVSGWWLMDNGSGGHGQPDEIVAWQTRNPFIKLGADLVTDSTIIAPGQYALVLAPYYAASGGVAAPYDIPPGTVILTVATGSRIGDDYGGLWGTVDPRDVVVLYVGTNRRVDTVVSTYGTPKPIASGSNPLDIMDDGLDGIPRHTMDCYSAQRLNAAGPDVESNWRLLLGTPGYSHDH